MKSQKKTNKDINNRLVIDTLYNFIIDTENIILNQYENYTSITAPIFRINNNTEVVENLFIHKTNSGSYKAFIVKYSLSDSDLVNYSNNIPISNLASKTSFIVLDNFNLNNINNRDNSLENTTYSGGYSGIVYNIDGQCYRIHEVFQDGTFSLIHCPGCSCSSNNNSVPNLFENDGSGGTSNVLIFTWPTSGGEDYDPFSGIGGSGGNYSGGNTLITEPVVTQNRTEQKLLQSFTTLEQANWWLFVAPDDAKNNIINYLNQNTTNNIIEPVALNFVFELLDEIRDNLSNNTPLPESTVLELNNPISRINNISDYLKCFDLSQSASFTIYVDQPTPNSNSAWSGNPIDPNVWHTFISIKQGTTRRVLGYYPSSAVDLTDPSSPGSFENDSAHSYDVAISININPTQLTSLINYIKSKANSTYNLNSYNCTDFAMESSSFVGMPLGSAYGSWGLGAGDNPGQLGQNIRNMPTPAGGIKTTTSGTAQSNIGTCN